jgi:hypothetical protein
VRMQRQDKFVSWLNPENRTRLNRRRVLGSKGK